MTGWDLHPGRPAVRGRTLTARDITFHVFRVRTDVVVDHPVVRDVDREVRMAAAVTMHFPPSSGAHLAAVGGDSKTTRLASSMNRG